MTTAKKRKPSKTEVLKAVEGNRAGDLKRLLDAGGDPNATDGRKVDGKTPLHIACMRGCPETVRLLLSHGADVNVKDIEGRTPLYYACEKNDATLPRRDYSRPEDHLDIARALIAAGADVNAVGRRFSYSPLHKACIKDHDELVVFLLGHGANVDARDNRSRTPLHMACYSCHAVAQALIEAGADVNAKDIRVRTPLHDAIEAGRTDILQLLLDHGSDMEVRDKHGYAPIHYACKFGNATTVQFLLEKGADANAQSKHKHTPLHVACHNGHTETVRLLLDHGADPNARSKGGTRNKVGTTPLDLALNLETDHPYREEIIDLFREHAPEAVMETWCAQAPGGMR